MSCGPEPVRFRLLDGFVGWSPSAATLAHSNLSGLDVDGGVLELALLSPGAVPQAELDACLPPPFLARGCGPCEWFLATQVAPYRLLRRCSSCFVPVALAPALAGPASLAVRQHRVVVSDPSAGRVFVLARAGEQTVAVIEVVRPGPVALGEGEFWLAVDGEARLRRYDLAGVRLADFAAALPPDLRVVRLARAGRVLFAVASTPSGELHLYRAEGEGPFVAATLAEAASMLGPTGLLVSASGAFCETFHARSGDEQQSCFAADGSCATTPVEPPPPPPRRVRGQLLTLALDSGITRCRWHRVRIDADVPLGTSLAVDVATSDDATPPSQGVPDNGWTEFDSGPMHPSDWQLQPPGALDYLVQQPPGRYLFVRVRLTGDGSVTPRVRRVRLDLPRSTSLERLPAVYRETLVAEDFGERFLSLFDATIEAIDRSITRAPALLDGGGVPEAILPWLGNFLDLAFDPQWTGSQRRELIAAAPALYAARGTAACLKRVIAIVTGTEPVIRETALARPFGAVAPRAPVAAGEYAVLGSVRLFGRSTVRFRVGTSALGVAPLKSFGNPDQDPLWAQAFRFRVLLPKSAVGPRPEDRARLEKLIAAQKPAHTVAVLDFGDGDDGFVVGVSALDAVSPLVLGADARLGRGAVVAASRRGPYAGFTVGHAQVGEHTVVS